MTIHLNNLHTPISNIVSSGWFTNIHVLYDIHFIFYLNSQTPMSHNMQKGRLTYSRTAIVLTSMRKCTVPTRPSLFVHTSARDPCSGEGWACAVDKSKYENTFNVTPLDYEPRLNKCSLADVTHRRLWSVLRIHVAWKQAFDGTLMHLSTTPTSETVSGCTR